MNPTRPAAAPFPEPDGFEARLRWLGWGMGLLLLVLAARAAQVTLLDARAAEVLSRRMLEPVRVRGERGPILDRHGGPLAMTVRLADLRADPQRLHEAGVDLSALAARLGEELGRPAGELARLMADPARRDVLLAEGLDPARARALAGLAGVAGGLFTRDRSHRTWPGGELAVQLLGVTHRDGHGLEGIERALDPWLDAESYRYVRERDRKGRSLTECPASEGMLAGDTVVLALDRHVQAAAETALDGVVERTRPRSAMAVVVDVATGELLAVANRPATNPNRPDRDVAGLRNHAVLDAYEPGSVIKPFVMALALEDGLLEPDTPLDCERSGRWRLGRRTIHDDHPVGVVPAWQVIQKSSNICAARLALELGARRTIEGLRRFGFAEPPGTGLHGEAAGRLRAPDRIRPIELATTAYGQGMTASALQLAMGMAALGNGGRLMEPLLVREIRDPLDGVRRSRSPRVRRRAVSERVAREVVAMMETVVQEGGTAPLAAVPGYSVAGKTGTAQRVIDGAYSRERVAVFAGLAPASAPRVAIAVLVDMPQGPTRYGGTVAGPVFAEIAAATLRHLGVPPDRPEERLPEDGEARDGRESRAEEAAAPLAVAPPAWEILPGPALRLPSLAGLSLRDALAAVDGTGLRLALVGSGRVVEQEPEPGRTVRPGDSLRLVLR